MTVSDIIKLLGGTSAVAKFTGWPTSTVDSWITFNQVPDWRKSKLLDMAVCDGKALSATDFPPPTERTNPRKVAA